MSYEKRRKNVQNNVQQKQKNLHDKSLRQRKIYVKYRSHPQGKDYSETHTQNDIYNFLRSNDYYIVKNDYRY